MAKNKVSEVKKSNIQKNRSRTQKKLEKKKKAKRNKNTPIADRKPITYYDEKKKQQIEKEWYIQQKKQKEEEKLKRTKQLKIRKFGATDDLLDPNDLEKLIEEDDKNIEEIAKNTMEKERRKEAAIIAKAKKILNNGEEDKDDEEQEEEDDEMEHANEAEMEFIQKRVIESKKKIEEKAAAEERAAQAPGTLLPIISADGEIVTQRKPNFGTHKTDAEDSGIDEDGTPAEGEMKKVISTVEILAERKRKLDHIKLYIGCSGPKIISNPDEQMDRLSKLVKFVYENDVEIALTVRKLAAYSLLQIFNNILPNYTLATLDRGSVKLAKRTRETAVKEARLLSRYKYYLKGLEAMLETAERKQYTEYQIEMATISLKCFSDLLMKHPLLNFSENIITLLVPHLSNRVDKLRTIVVQAFEKMLKEDENGQFSLRILKVVNLFIRKKSFMVHEDCLKVFLHLRITQATPLDSLTSRKLDAKRDTAATEKLLKKFTSKSAVKLSISDKKRKHKIAKLEHKLKEKKMNEKKGIQATVQTDMIEILFAMYIHVVKYLPNRKVLGIVLEGMSLFGHLISVNYFTDLLASLEKILIYENLSNIETIHCVQTVFKLLTGLGEALPNDPASFVQRLYGILIQLPDPKTEDNAVLSALETLLLFFIKCKKRVGVKLSIGFVKRLATIALATAHNHSIPILMALRSILLNHKSADCLLDTSGEGASGVYQPELNHPIHCNAEVTAIYEMHSLARSYHPMIRQIAKHLYKGAPLLGDGCLPASFTKLNMEKIIKDYSTSEMEFQPKLMDPKQYIKPKTEWSGTEKKKIASTRRFSDALQIVCEEEMDAIDEFDRQLKSMLTEDELSILCNPPTNSSSRVQLSDILEESEEIMDYTEHLVAGEEDQ